MIRSFEVGAVFQIINKASPALTAILRQVRALNEQVEKARANLAELGKASTLPTKSMDGAIAQTRELAAQWRNVARSAGEARMAIGAAASRSGASAAIGAAAAATGGSGRAHGGSTRSLFGHTHLRGPGVGLPGGSHLHLGGAAMAGAGLIGYGAYEAAEMQDVVTKILYTTGLKATAANRAQFRQIIQQAMVTSGYGVKDVGTAALKELQMLQGTPGHGIGILPEMLRGAATESLLKGSSLGESMTALIGLAHMTRSYDPTAIKKLIPAFAFLSTANPSSLASMEKAASYAVPILQSGLEIDPLQSLLMGTVLTRAGATNTKSGTWLRNLMLRAMPGTSLMSRAAFKKHEIALEALGLVDSHGKPTWFDHGKPDPFRMLQIASAHAAAIPLTERASLEKQLFGAQGFGAFAMLADPKVRTQINQLSTIMHSSAFQNRYSSFMASYAQNSTVQQARTALEQFNVTMMQLATPILPTVTGVLKDFQTVLKSIQSVIPGASGNGGTSIAKRAVEGALGFGILGSVVPGVGTLAGVLGGAVVGGVEGVAEQYMRQRFPESFRTDKLGTAQQKETDALHELTNVIKELLGSGMLLSHTSYTGGKVAAQPISLSLNLDGRTLAQAISHQLADLYGFSTGAAVGNGASRWNSGELGT